MKGSAESSKRQGPSTPWPEVWRAVPFATCFATWFGCGFLPFVPGTWGSAATVPVAVGIYLWSGLAGLAALAAVTSTLGIVAADRTARRRGVGDPSEIVIDEVAGQSIALVGVFALAPVDRGAALTAGLVIASFVLFRVLDILKPGPIRSLESLPGGVGIVLDDLASGVVAALLLGAVRYAMRW